MALVFFGGEGRRRRKHPKPQPQTTQNVYPSFPVQGCPPKYPPNSQPPIPPAPSYHPPIPPPAPQYGSPPQYSIQHYMGGSTMNLAAPPPQPPRPSKSHYDLGATLTSQAGRSVSNLISKKSTQALNQGAALCDRISSKLDAVLTSIDEECFSGQEQDLLVYDIPEPYQSTSTLRPGTAHRGPPGNEVYPSSGGKKGSNHFSKVWLYSNSRLPPHLPPFKAYISTWPLLCLAASYSERVYTPPSSTPEVEAHVPADWRSGTKAMVLKSVPIDDMHTIVFAIRGSATFMDWAVNYKSAPSSPEGFLDDEGNLCHSGFLYVARKMVAPVAQRLRTLLEENPSRSHCSLLITGHSAGGAVAALLYSHMMSSNVHSELSHLTSFFKRVHCITFGAPPVSLLPLQRPNEKRHRKSLFYSFINEGDPVPRADKQVVRSLLKLYAKPVPSSICSSTFASLSKLNLSSNQSNSTLQTTSSRPSKTSKFSKFSHNTSSTTSPPPIWNLPATTLSTAGRLIVIRDKPGRSYFQGDVEAVTVDDQLLRTVVYGDPLKHMMSLYQKRIEQLATKAVTAGGY